MNINKTLFCLKDSYSKLPKLSYCRYIRSSTILSPKLVSVQHYQSKIVQNQTSFSFLSSAANEELIKPKQSSSVIIVPTLHFDDVSFDQPVSHDQLCNELQICNSLEDQMATLTSTLSLSSSDIQHRLNFCRTIESLLRPFFGEIKIQIFGSTVNGFGFKGCDLDLSFETFAEPREKVSYLDPPDVPLVSEVISGKVSPSEISSLPPKEQLLFIHSVFLEFYKESEDPTIFINCHVPLIRFYHDRYGLKCDLTCRNRVAFANTKLLYLLRRLDERVIPLMMTIRYWAKHVELIGKGLMFNTYTISLMVIHFLQTRNPPVLPSAEHILSLSDSLNIDDMNDKSFLAIKRLIPPSENSQTLSELLRDFFFYYLYFDFTRVICPLIGGSVPREQFFTESTSKKFRMNSICVQDPMLVTHNVAELVDYKSCRKFFAELITACRIFQNSSAFLPSSSKWGLLALLNKTEDLHLKKKLQTNVSVTVPFITKQIFGGSGTEDAELHTAETLMQLLRHVLLFECNILETSKISGMLKQHDETIAKQKKYFESVNYRNTELVEYYEKQKKRFKCTKIDIEKFSNALMLEEFQKFNLENKLILCAECKVTKNTWLGRNHVSLEFLPIDSVNRVIDKERYISINAAKQNAVNALDDKMKPFTFFCECYVSPELPKSTVLVNFRPFQKTSFNPILEIFLKEYLLNLIKNLNEDC